MSLLLFLATLPSLYWAQPVETAPALKQAGIERLCVPTEAAAAWTAAGFTVVPLGEKDRAERTKLRAPGLRSRAEVASATVRPWVNANGWRFLRKPGDRYWGDVPAGKAALAAAEAFAYGADAVLAIDPADLDSAGTDAGLPVLGARLDLPPAADIAVVDDGSPPVGEILNLMARRNLLFEVVPGSRPTSPSTSGSARRRSPGRRRRTRRPSPSRCAAA